MEQTLDIVEIFVRSQADKRDGQNDEILDIVEIFGAAEKAIKDFAYFVSAPQFPWAEFSKIDDVAILLFRDALRSFKQKLRFAVSDQSVFSLSLLALNYDWLMFACADLDRHYHYVINCKACSSIISELEASQSALQALWSTYELVSKILNQESTKLNKKLRDTILEQSRITNEFLSTSSELDDKIKANQVTINAIAENLGITKQAVTKRVKRLVRDGWIAKQPTHFKKIFYAYEAKIIEENPSGRKAKI